MNKVEEISNETPGAGSDPVQPGAVIISLDNGLLPNSVADELYWAQAARRFTGKSGRPSELDPDSLPYRSSVLEMISDARAEGKRILLDIGPNAEFGPRIAAHLGIFDGMVGAAQALPSDVGPYIYLGGTDNSQLWREAAHVVTVDASVGARNRADAHRGGATHVGTPQDTWAALLRAARPHQWLKNVLIFLPLLASHQFEASSIMAAGLAFIAFCLVASSVYLLNDLLDLEADRNHPRKRNRPFASGALPLSLGRRSVLALLIGGLAIGIFAGPVFVLVLLAYYAFTLLYSFVLKRRAIIDICTLAGLYTLRIVAGAAAADIPLSVWLLAFSIFLFLSLAAMKRQAELVDMLAGGREEVGGRGYAVGDLPLVSQMAISSGYLSVLVMALYLNSPDVQVLYSEPALLWGVCLVLLFWISRAVFKTHRGEMDDDPIVFALKDRISRICVLLVAGLLFIAMLV